RLELEIRGGGHHRGSAGSREEPERSAIAARRKRNRAVERLVAAASALDLDQRGVLPVRPDRLVRFVPDHAAELQSLRGLLVRNVELERVEGLAREIGRASCRERG